MNQIIPSNKLKSGSRPGAALDLGGIEAELKSFRAEEMKRLGLVEEAFDHWIDANPQTFTRQQRETTTLLFGGLTQAQDYLISGALKGLGYKVAALEVPDNESLRFGKEFGNRGQCNPTYFTVGNLIKHLSNLEQSGIPRQDIVNNYAFITAGSCGPCRFGMYVTEYRKALRDAGFEGFRVLIFQDDGGLQQASGEEAGLHLNPTFFLSIVKALLIGDILNVLGYRIRPYEVLKGSTDQALTACKKLLHDTFMARRNVMVALWKCRRILAKVEVNWLQPKPKVSLIGEFWAMTTEGDGNYRLQRFLEQEGAEVEIQPIVSWLLYQIWQCRWDTRRRMMLRRQDDARMGLGDANIRKRLILVRVAEVALHATFKTFCVVLGLKHYKLTDMDEIATISHQHYDNHLRGGEGHMEVGKLMQAAKKRKAHMVLSVKPFGCMPSSGVSDGVQSLVSERHPEAIFCAVETTGDAAVNMYSRVQMQLFKARQLAVQEFEEQLRLAERTAEQMKTRLRRFGRSGSINYPTVHGIAGTGARLVRELRPAWPLVSGRARTAAKPVPSAP